MGRWLTLGSGGSGLDEGLRWSRPSERSYSDAALCSLERSACTAGDDRSLVGEVVWRLPTLPSQPTNPHTSVSASAV
jgi:hypothetical protein